MIYLVLCVICSSLLVFMFRVFDHYRIEAFPAIVFNYLTCVICGFIASGRSPVTVLSFAAHADWLWLAVIMGILFIHIFVLTASTALRFGVSTASVAMKLGLVIPLFLAFFIYHEAIMWNKIAGIICALIAVWLSAQKDEAVHHDRVKGLALLLPIVVFIGSGLCDSGAQLGDKIYFSHASSAYFVLVTFLCAALTGISYLTIMIMRGSVTIHWKQIAGGIALGIPNYGSLLFLMKALDQVPGGSSVVFPVTNIATVAGSTLLSVLIFREHLNRANRWGIAFAGLCIAFIYLPQIMSIFHR
jgi:drug/metabolite transporter (DMT)-like permease